MKMFAREGVSTLVFGSLVVFSSLTAVLAEPISAAARAVASPVVDLGYSKYQGYYDADSSLYVYKGIRYAKPPVGKLRWQAPENPVKNNTLISAAVDPPNCPQSGAAGTPAAYGFNSGPGNEDCLYLNVYAPPNAKNLPVFFWIRG
jgi:carboxylesterase type B